MRYIKRELEGQVARAAKAAKAKKQTFLRLAGASKARGGRKIPREEMHQRG